MALRTKVANWASGESTHLGILEVVVSAMIVGAGTEACVPLVVTTVAGLWIAVVKTSWGRSSYIPRGGGKGSRGWAGSGTSQLVARHLGGGYANGDTNGDPYGSMASPGGGGSRPGGGKSPGGGGRTPGGGGSRDARDCQGLKRLTRCWCRAEGCRWLEGGGNPKLKPTLMFSGTVGICSQLAKKRKGGAPGRAERVSSVMITVVPIMRQSIPTMI